MLGLKFGAKMSDPFLRKWLLARNINVFVTFLVLIFVQAAFTSPVARFSELLIEDIEKAKKLNSRIKEEDRTLCPTHKSKDMSSCLKSFLLSFEIQSSGQIVLIVLSALTAAQIDKSKGYDKNTVMLMLVDNAALTLERIDAKRLRIVKLNTGVKSEEKDIKILRESESNNLIESKKGILSMLNTKLAEIEQALSRSPASNSPGVVWQKRKYAELKIRVEVLERKTWKVSEGP